MQQGTETGDRLNEERRWVLLSVNHSTGCVEVAQETTHIVRICQIEMATNRTQSYGADN